MVFKDGRPDFSPWKEFEIEFKPGELNGTQKDFDLVYEKLVEMGMAKNKAQAKKLLKDELELTPDHFSETVIQMILSKIHGNVPHKGSASDMRNKADAIDQTTKEKDIKEDTKKGGAPKDDDDG
ncbi:hypothetical protein ASD24_05540 [Paenibacillus sp. Root52]|uniref:Uncharacterized protein n=1 Tax=Paenibacillus amylolyticus TaxID=1451 RepID=A0AAP5H6B9_PAEAM|nr:MULTISPECIES: hypothetical protein [Paenibacillus]KQY87324.1 hypothetical protein ASD24_05540 [Paenibacillus sp. Root52]MDR6725548.1 hypothetical protein [Paenibacillus amylolyticus]